MIIINYSFEYTDGSIGYGEIESLKNLNETITILVNKCFKKGYKSIRIINITFKML